MNTIYTFILSFSIIQLTAQSANIDELKNSLIELKKDNSQKNQREFFNLFPSSFQSFNNTFGFKNGTAAPLYDGHEYISQFFSLDSIDQRKQLNKWINISIDGHWDADAVNYFQMYLRLRVFQNLDLTFKLLKERPEKEIKSFFYFFFNEIHPQYETIPKEFEILKNSDNELYILILEGHKLAIQDSGH
mgnify:CR=1 FL=1